jgi:uncharacterized protein YjbI with pentapeptide repeats
MVTVIRKIRASSFWLLGAFACLFGGSAEASCDPSRTTEGVLKACSVLSDSNQSGYGLQSSLLDGLRGLRVNFTESNLSFSRLNEAVLRETMARKTVLIGIQGKNLRFVGGDFSSADFSGSNLESCEFRGVFAPFADFRKANLSGCRFIRSYLAGAKWDGANLDRAQFVESFGAPSLRQSQNP